MQKRSSCSISSAQARREEWLSSLGLHLSDLSLPPSLHGQLCVLWWLDQSHCLRTMRGRAQVQGLSSSQSPDFILFSFHSYGLAIGLCGSYSSSQQAGANAIKTFIQTARLTGWQTLYTDDSLIDYEPNLSRRNGKRLPTVLGSNGFLLAEAAQPQSMLLEMKISDRREFRGHAPESLVGGRRPLLLCLTHLLQFGRGGKVPFQKEQSS